MFPAACTNPAFTGLTATDSNGNQAVVGGNDVFCITNPTIAGNVGAELQSLSGFVVGSHLQVDGVRSEQVDSARAGSCARTTVLPSCSATTKVRIPQRHGPEQFEHHSLFDFTQGNFNLLGREFTPGVLICQVIHCGKRLRQLHVWEPLHEGPDRWALRCTSRRVVPIRQLVSRTRSTQIQARSRSAPTTPPTAHPRVAPGHTQTYGGWTCTGSYPILPDGTHQIPLGSGSLRDISRIGAPCERGPERATHDRHSNLILANGSAC